MKLKPYIQPQLARLLSSHGLKNTRRRLWRARQALSAGQPVVDVWLRAADPYSYLLVQVLPQLQQRFAVNWRFRVIADLQDDMYPQADMWHHNAQLDASRLARLYGLQAPTGTPSIAQQELACGRLLVLQQQAVDWTEAGQVLDDLWQSRVLPAVALSSAQRQLLQANERQLQRDGHYLSATLKFQGEWYWGLDRLDHLEQRLNQLGLNRGPAEVIYNKTYSGFCRHYEPAAVVGEAQAEPLLLYFSARSPYSHLGLERAVQLAQHYAIPLQVKPVLPMMMRGLSVPAAKKFYIFHDTRREADKFGIRYGYVADPLGAGVERCYALFEYARRQGKEIDYLLSFARGVNAEGVLSETDSGLKRIVERAGLSWSAAQRILQQPDWRSAWQGWAEANRQEMLALGQWGVPTFHYNGLTVWGQDRLEFIEQAIRQQLQLPD